MEEREVEEREEEEEEARESSASVPSWGQVIKEEG